MIDRDITPDVRAWLHQPVALDDRGLADVLAKLPMVVQSRPRWEAWRPSRAPASRPAVAPRRILLALFALLVALMLMAAWALVGQQPASPLAFAPGSIAFTRDGSLYVAAAAGSHEVQLAQGDPESGQIHPFAFAPSGRALAFAGGGPSGAELVLMAPDGHIVGARPFGDPNTASWFSWAPGGDQLVMSEATDHPQLSIVGLDGQETRTLALPDGFTWGWLPDLGSWSPDGRWIALFGCVQPCDIKFDPHVLLVAADGSGWHWLEGGPSGYLAREAWTPDSRLALAGPGYRELVSVGADGSGTTSPGLVVSIGGTPVWSPDGTRWASAAGSLLEVGTDSVSHVVDRSSSAPGRADDLPGTVVDVGWSADGRDLLFVGMADGSPVRSLYAIDPQGGTPRMLIEGVDEAFDVAGAR